MTDAITMSVPGIASAYDSPPQVKASAKRAVVWRYQTYDWTAADLVEVLEALGLA
jgi:hypothetical protein